MNATSFTALALTVTLLSSHAVAQPPPADPPPPPPPAVAPAPSSPSPSPVAPAPTAPPAPVPAAPAAAPAANAPAPVAPAANAPAPAAPAVSAPAPTAPAPVAVAPEPVPPPPAPPPGAPRRLRYGVTPYVTTAFGVRAGKFVNVLAGGRMAFNWDRRSTFEVGVAYANLKGREGRVHNVLPEISMLFRLPLPGRVLGVPFRVGAGYLPKNGPTLRASLGLDAKVSDSTILELSLLEPMVWVTNDRSELSLGVSGAARIAF